MISHFKVVHFIKDNRFTVLNDKSNKLKNQTRAQIEIDASVSKLADI